MSQEFDSQGWQIVINKKNKNKKIQDIPQTYSPIPAIQRQILAQQQAEKLESKQIKYVESTNSSQDWNPVVFSKTSKVVPINHSHSQSSSPIKTDESGNIIQIKKVSPQMAQEIIKARIAKKWTQKQLHLNSTVDVKTISEIEKGGCLYVPEVFNKLCNSLGVKIERNCILEKKI